MLRLVALSARCRLLRVGAAAISAPRASCVAVVGTPPFSFPRHAETPRFFSLQKKDDDNDDTGSSWTTLALYDPTAWREAVKPAFLTFLKLKKHLMVPVAFTVPNGDAAWPRAVWGYPLGKHAVWLRKKWRDGGHKIDPEQLNELNEMPFAWDWSQYKWDHFILPALRRFFELNGQTDVPYRFRVPNGDSQWPEHLWGLHLGRKVRIIRAQDCFSLQIEKDSEELERLKFCHDSTVRDHDWRKKLIPALKVFRLEFGHCNVSRNFTVPASPPWPEAAWDMRLGETVQYIRAGQLGADRDHQELEELGFVWNRYDWEWSNRILPALDVFRRVEGHCRVPLSFVVPSIEVWPKQAWGLKLGTVVNRIRSADAYSAQITRDKSQLEAWGFVWDVSESEWSERIFPSLKTFRQVKGHCRVPQSFVVPSIEVWPKQAWGLKLGSVVRGIRSADAYSGQITRDKAQLEALGFVWDVCESEWSERIFPSLKTFRQVKGHCRVPQSFVVPSIEVWPKQAWGVKLGSVVNSIRSADAYSGQITRDKAQLEALGFVWESKWNECILPAWQVFYEECGHSWIPRSFVVPFEAPWPIEAHGLKLGSAVESIRNRGAYFDHTVRSMNLLEAIEFELKIPASRWATRVEPLLATFEQLHGNRNVPDEFAVPSSAPWLEKDWGIPLGRLRMR